MVDLPVKVWRHPWVQACVYSERKTEDGFWGGDTEALSEASDVGRHQFVHAGRMSSRSRGASHVGNTAGSRRTIVSAAASTRGRGRNAPRPMVAPEWNSHHGAHAAVRSDVGG